MNCHNQIFEFNSINLELKNWKMDGMLQYEVISCIVWPNRSKETKLLCRSRSLIKPLGINEKQKKTYRPKRAECRRVGLESFRPVAGQKKSNYAQSAISNTKQKKTNCKKLLLFNPLTTNKIITFFFFTSTLNGNLMVRYDDDIRSQNHGTSRKEDRERQEKEEERETLLMGFPISRAASVDEIFPRVQSSASPFSLTPFFFPVGEEDDGSVIHQHNELQETAGHFLPFEIFFFSFFRVLLFVIATACIYVYFHQFRFHGKKTSVFPIFSIRDVTSSTGTHTRPSRSKK